MLLEFIFKNRHILYLGQYLVVKKLTTKSIAYPEPKIGGNEHLVLIKNVQHQNSVLPRTLHAIIKQQSPDHPELRDSEIGSSRRLSALNALDAHSDVGLGDHRNIVRAIANRQSNCLWPSQPHQLNHLLFLLRGNSTHQDSLHLKKIFSLPPPHNHLTLAANNFFTSCYFSWLCS